MVHSSPSIVGHLLLTTSAVFGVAHGGRSGTDTFSLLSNFLPVRFFGFLVVVSIGGCLLAALILMPPLMLLARPRYAEPKDR